MAQAIFGLAGVLVGGLITAGIQERQRRVIAQARRRVGARVVRDELLWFRGSLDIALKHQDESRVFDSASVKSTWREHRDALEAMPWKDWAAIEAAVGVAGLFRTRDAPRWADSTGEYLEGIRREVDTAVTLLRAHVD